MDTVLIVDDSSFIVEGLISFLKKKYRTIAAYGGAECLAVLTRETPSVIILDIMMEPMDGWETLARIKENPATRHIPVLMFSAKKISPEEAAEHGICIDDFIQKPVFPKKILEAIDKVLARRDTNMKVVKTWKAAGISQEKIDEYLALVTSLEVDLSLCQNMKMQCDLSHPEDTDQIQVRAVIAAIEDRIRQERGMIENLVLAMNDILHSGPESGKSAGTGSSPVAGESVSRSQASGTGSDTCHKGPLSMEMPCKTTVAGPTVPVPADPSTADPDPADALASPNLSVSRPVPGHMDHDTRGTDQTQEPVDPERASPGSPRGPVPVRTEVFPPEEVPVFPRSPSVTGIDETRSSRRGGARPDEQKDDFATNPETSPLFGSPAASPAPPVQDPPVTDERKVIPADLDIPPDTSGTSPLTGAGTDGPMPWDTVKERKPQRLLTELAEKNASLTTGSDTPPRGIVARLLSFVLSLLGKRYRR
jgi:CheY-like chemotaxis protein